MKIINICLFLIVILSCTKHKPLMDSDTNTQLKVKKEIHTKQMKYINPEEVKNWTLEQIKEKYKPIQEEDFLLNEAIISEFRIGLYNFFDEKERKKPITIKEITWEKDQNTNYTIWYRKELNQWVFIDSFIWDKNSEF